MCPKFDTFDQTNPVESLINVLEDPAETPVFKKLS